MPNLTEIADTKERDTRRAFIRAFNDIKNTTKITDLERAIESQNFEAVYRILGLDPSSFEALSEEIRQSYRTGGLTGIAQIGTIPDPSGLGGMSLKFDMMADDAIRWVTTHSAELITEVIEDQRVMVRDVVTEGLVKGTNPRQTAISLVGKIDKATGKRKGGHIGLTASQSQWVSNARSELENLDSSYFRRNLRDARLDSIVRSAIDSGEELSRSQIDNIIVSMQNRTLKYRADVIARTESINALRAGQHESVAQAVTKGEIDSQHAKKTWDASGDSRTRDDHMFMEGQERRIDQPFNAPDGSELLYPGDTSLNAPAKQTIQCRCREVIEIDFIGKLIKLNGFR